MIGKILGHYEILEPLGAGGMGEVYRARDATLKRDVAIKVLPEDLAVDPERLARMEREAHLLASLNHPNIATIHSLEKADGTRFLVMELVKGESLEQLIAAGPMSVEDALGICRQIARALEAAHAEGIIHRDLKPANVLITPDRRAKVLDFGLAKPATATSDSSGADMTRSPTVTVAGTQAGVILGTAPYMSPEQIRGQPLDKRADIWAFGCVFYETLTRKRAFNRETVADTLAAVLDAEPDWETLPAATPPIVVALLRRCLRKDPDSRLHDIADARIEIEEALVEPAGETVGERQYGTRSMSWRWAIPLTLAALIVGAMVGMSVLRPATSVAKDPISVTVSLGPGERLSGGVGGERAAYGLLRPSRTAIALSPDGRQLVYSAEGPDGQQLFLRPMSRSEATPIPGTEGGCCPFFSPAGDWVGFWAQDTLMRVPLDGGPARTIAERVVRPFGASWGDNDTIVFAGPERSGLHRVSAAAGEVETLTTVAPDNGEFSHRLPQVLPGSRAVLYSVRTARTLGGASRDAKIAVRSIDGGEATILLENGSDPRFVPTGHIVFARQGTLWAVAFDLDRLAILGEPVRILEDVMQTTYAPNDDSLDTGAAQLTFSEEGTLAYATGGVFPPLQGSLAWVDHEGSPVVLDLPPDDRLHPRISPDGRYLAYSKGRMGERNIWVYDIMRGTEAPLTSEGGVSSVWSPDSHRVVYARFGNLYWKAADGSGEALALTESDRSGQPSSWRGGMLAFVKDPGDIWVLPMDEAGAEPWPFLATDAIEASPAFSPDGGWLAYASNDSSNESSPYRVWVRPFPGPDPPYLVSDGLGYSPAWSRDGRQLYYRNGSSRMMVVDVTYEPTIRFSTPRLLFEKRYDLTGPVRDYDTLDDGRFIMAPPIEQEPEPVTQINIVLNWFEELKRLVPTGGSR